ncbi:MAG TPA: class I SAM-dependent methyltransferase [Humisphaera sp.]
MPPDHAADDDLPDDLSIRAEYERLGPDAYYRLHGADYRNPHEHAIGKALRTAVERWRPDLSRVLDLAAGSGEATLVLRSLGAGDVAGIDPFTHAAYERRTGRPCEPMTFEQVAAGGLAGRSYSLVVCSFAMHLVAESRLPLLASQLAAVAPAMWILTPHKRPRIDERWGWTLADELVVQRVRVRTHRSTMFHPA